jgi:hypothetical protein
VADKKRVEAVMRPVGEGVDFSLIDEFRRLGGPLSTKHMRPKTDIGALSISSPFLNLIFLLSLIPTHSFGLMSENAI